MIKINKPSSPQILINNQNTWTQNLLHAISRYNGYSNIPKYEKDALLKHYRHPEIQETLFNCSHRKCSFCECKPEESGNMEVEHFSPKSLYPQLTFDWNNLLPSCRKCNIAKRDHDTITDPIINPSQVDPQDYFTFNTVRIIPKCDLTDTSKNIAQKTIDVCNLNCPRLYTKRAELLVNIYSYLDVLKSYINEIDSTPTNHSKLIKLQNSIDTIESLLSANQLLSAYCSHHILNAPEYKQAKQLLSTLTEA